MNQTFVEFIQQRSSSPRLAEPAPTKMELEMIFKSALRTPDHMMLRPWRYLVIEGDARAKLGDLFLKSAQLSADESVASGKPIEEINEFKAEKFKSMPLRAPMLVVAIACYSDHPKVPKQEQLLSCGVGVGYMLLSLQALGYGGIWRTGDMAFNPHVSAGLGLKEHESIVGFLYIGTPVGEAKPIPDISVDQYFTPWV